MSNASPNFSISVNLFRTTYITYKIEVAVSWRRSCGRGWLWEGTCGRVPDSPLDVMDVAIGLNQRKLALLADFWVKFGSQFRTFDVQVTATRPGETSEGLALQRIRINEAPVGGTCTAEVMQDIHKEEEEEEEEGSFEVEVRVGREEPPTLIVTALTEGFEIPKYSFFGVSDQLGAETLYMTTVVIPLLPSQELFKEYQTRLSDNKANDEEEEDESSATQEKNKDMLSSVDKFSITSMDEVLQVNNILGSIADPLPKESQEGVVAALKTALPLWLNRRTLLLGLWLPLLVSLRV
ncbi:hypothetical protein Pmani_022844 [Petrolisthes manimaculis]|uniref:Uncharacterized protein n=1 Tax=Petrolisthes manimaculis TaxID=1843537 RepID=A0AAE1PDP8_9EUCA|nr:hypothetical protein Pmani_022844 [Petrolisthes manimaculis]